MTTQPSSGDGQVLRKLNMRLVSTPHPHHTHTETGPQVFGRIVSQTQRGMKNPVVHNVLRVDWARSGSVRMTEVDNWTIAFEFESERDKEKSRIWHHGRWRVIR